MPQPLPGELAALLAAYVMEPMAERMLADDPEVRASFQKRIAEDQAFRDDPSARLRWFYEKTPFFDDRTLLYPVGREEP